VQLKTGVKFVLGQNYRGLVAAHEIVKVKIGLIFIKYFFDPGLPNIEGKYFGFFIHLCCFS
jgi:hypothetical protein